MTLAIVTLSVLLAATLASAAWLVSKLVAMQDRHVAGLLEAERAHRDNLLASFAEVQMAATPDLTELVSLVDRLCQRVQAPVQAVAEHSIGAFDGYPMPAAVLPDDDDAYHAARLSKDELAEQSMLAEVGG